MTQYVTVEACVLADGEPRKWEYPVARNTPVNAVREVLGGLLRLEGVEDLTSLSFRYPAGEWHHPLAPGAPVIGLPGGHRPEAPAPRPAPDAQSAPAGFTPFPGAATARNPGAVANDLQSLLSAWAARHRLSGAEYYHFLALTMASHAAYLVEAEAKQRSQRQ